MLANGVSEVLRGHCVRSNGGLWYGSYAEFREALWILLTRPGVADSLGRAGQVYVAEHYLKREAWVAAVYRSRYCIENYDGAPATRQRMTRIAHCNLA